MNWIYQLDIEHIIFIITFMVLSILFLMHYFFLRKKVSIRSIPLVLKMTLRTTYFSLFIIALLGPSWMEKKKEIKVIAKDIFIAIDISESMNAIDIQPSRLERVKFQLKEFIKQLAGDRIGLILFSSDAFVQCPLTYDQSAIQLFIETLQTNLVSSRGTDFTPALRIALEKLTTENRSPSTNHSKIILLISDGEDFGTDSEEIIKKIKKENIYLFTWGIGTRQGGRIPLSSGGFMKDDTNKDVITKLKAESLQEMSKKTNGSYFETSDQINEIDKLTTTLQQLRGEIKEIKKVDTNSNAYFYFLVIGVFLFTFDILFKTSVIRL